jgi:hypothetical protein
VKDVTAFFADFAGPDSLTTQAFGLFRCFRRLFLRKALPAPAFCREALHHLTAAQAGAAAAVAQLSAQQYHGIENGARLAGLIGSFLHPSSASRVRAAGISDPDGVLKLRTSRNY